MSANIPPVPYFSGINFNPAFFNTIYEYLTEQIANTLYLKLRGGVLKGNLGIKKSPANVELDVSGKINISGFNGLPTTGIYGGSGTKLILKEGITGISPPIALGVNGDNLWMGGNFAGNVSIYTGVNERMTIRSSGNVGIGTINPFNNLDVYGANAKLAIRAASESETSTLYLATSASSILTGKTALIAEGISSYGRSKLHFCLNNGADNDNSASVADARMTILRDGKVGIGNIDPKSLLTLNNTPVFIDPPTYDFSTCPLTITNPNPTGTIITNDPKPVLNLCRDGTGGQSFASKASFSLCRYENSSVNSRTRLDIGLTNDYFNDVNVMSLRSDGKVGIGTSIPLSKFTIGADYSDVNSGLCIDANRDGLIFNLKIHPLIQGYSAIGHNFQVNNTGTSVNALTLGYNGYIGINNTNPNNILQVGNGSRLRISNGSTDYTTIGTNETAENLNTRIVLNAGQYSTNTGDIEYRATTTGGEHVFYSNHTTEKVRISPDDFQINTSCSTYNGGNYFTEGEYLNLTTKTNTSGVVKTGYFYNTSYFYSSLVMCAFSWFDGTTYRHWYGHVGTGNNTQILFIQPINSSLLAVENFVEQTTNQIWIYIYPTSSYGYGTDLRAKIYG